MKMNVVVAAVIIGFNLTACASFDPTLKGLIKIDTGATDQSLAQSKNSSTILVNRTSDSLTEEGCTVLPVRKSVIDVDTLYARAMARFTFKSPDQIAIYRKTVDKWYLVDQGYRHEKQNGAYYHLAQTVASGVPEASQAIWLELTFSKNGGSSDVTAEFCVNTKDPIGASSQVRSKISDRVMSIFSL